MNTLAKSILIQAGQAALKVCTQEQILEMLDPESSHVTIGVCSPPGTPSLTVAEKACLEVYDHFYKSKSRDLEDLRPVLHQIILWALYGFPIIRIVDQLAASFAMTSAPSKKASLPQAPWTAFAIDLSRDLFKTQTKSIGFVLCQDTPTSNREDDVSLFVFTDSELLPLRYVEDIEINDFPKEEKIRIQKIVSRVYAGICGELYDRRSDVEECERYARTSQRRKSKVPTAWAFVLGRNVNLDCRQDVRDYLEGRSKHLMTVQSLTRGHYKWQPYGPQNSLRKWIHIEPYWRGPEDAPIVLKEHVL